MPARPRGICAAPCIGLFREASRRSPPGSAGLTWFSVSGDALLPRLMADGSQVSQVWSYVPASASVLCLMALALLWSRRRSVLDLWLMVVLCVWLIETFLLGYISAGRFSVGWWAGRVYGLMSGSLVLLVLLSETTTLYAQLARSVSAERRIREARLTTMEVLSASIAHEVNQPLASMVTHADAGLRWLQRAEPDLDETKAALKSIVNDGHRAARIIESVRTVFRKGTRDRFPLDVNELIQRSARAYPERGAAEPRIGADRPGRRPAGGHRRPGPASAGPVQPGDERDGRHEHRHRPGAGASHQVRPSRCRQHRRVGRGCRHRAGRRSTRTGSSSLSSRPSRPGSGWA